MVPAHRVRALRAGAVCGRDSLTIAGLGDRRIGDLMARMRHDGCGGRPHFAELLTGIPGASRPIRRIVLIERDGR